MRIPIYFSAQFTLHKRITLLSLVDGKWLHYIFRLIFFPQILTLTISRHDFDIVIIFRVNRVTLPYYFLKAVLLSVLSIKISTIKILAYIKRNDKIFSRSVIIFTRYIVTYITLSVPYYKCRVASHIHRIAWKIVKLPTICLVWVYEVF